MHSVEHSQDTRVIAMTRDYNRVVFCDVLVYYALVLSGFYGRRVGWLVVFSHHLRNAVAMGVWNCIFYVL